MSALPSPPLHHTLNRIRVAVYYCVAEGERDAVLIARVLRQERDVGEGDVG